MTEENKVSKEDTEEPLYFELKDNISSFYISDSDILKCILIADANHKIPTLDTNWIKQAEIYIQKNKKVRRPSLDDRYHNLDHLI